MQVLAERTRQALGLGDKDFRPTSLEAQHRALGEASAFGSQLHTLERSLAKWASATDDTLRTAGHLLVTAARPRQFAQADPTDPASLQAQPPPPLPAPLAHLNHHPSLRHLAEGTPLAVADLVRVSLQEPIGVWLAALDAAKERVSSLDRLRVRYDAARRALHTASRAAGAGDVGNPAHTHLIRLEEDSEPVMTEYGLCCEAAQMHLDWLADQAARIKAAVAAALHAAADGAAAGTLAAPPGLLLPFPRELLAPPATLSATGRAAATAHQQQEAMAPAAAAEAGEPPSSSSFVSPSATSTTTTVNAPTTETGEPAVSAAAMADSALQAATTAAVLAAGTDAPPPQLIMLGPESPLQEGGGIAGTGSTEAVLLVPPGTAAVAAQAAVAAAAGRGAMAAPAGVRRAVESEQHMLAHSGGAVFSRLHRLVTNPERRRAVSAMWRVLASKALTHERSKGLPEHAAEEMRDVRERAGITGGFLMRPDMAPEYQAATRRNLPGGGPLQFLRDTLLGPKAVEEEDRLHTAHAQHATRHRHHAPEPPTAATVAPAVTGTEPGLPTAVGLRPTAAPASYDTALGAVQPATGAVDQAAAAREQMHEVASHGTGGAGAAETVTGQPGDAGDRVKEAPREQLPTGTGAGGSGGGGGGVGGFVMETLLGPKAEPGDRGAAAEQQLPAGHTALPPEATSNLAAAARYQMSTVATEGATAAVGGENVYDSSRDAAAGGGGSGRRAGSPLPGGGAADFTVDTLLGPLPQEGEDRGARAPAASGVAAAAPGHAATLDTATPALTEPTTAAAAPPTPAIEPRGADVADVSEAVAIGASAIELDTLTATEPPQTEAAEATAPLTLDAREKETLLPYDTPAGASGEPAPSAVLQQTEMALAAANVAMDTSAAGVDAATAAMAAAVSATDAAATALEAATDATVAAMSTSDGAGDVAPAVVTAEEGTQAGGCGSGGGGDVTEEAPVAPRSSPAEPVSGEPAGEGPTGVFSAVKRMVEEEVGEAGSKLEQQQQHEAAGLEPAGPTDVTV